jgi:hypothetical protein
MIRARRSGDPQSRGGSAVTAQNRRRVIAAERRLALLHQLVNDLLCSDARPARRTASEMLVDELPLGGSEFAVDVGGHQRINR